VTRAWRRAALVAAAGTVSLALACIYTGGDPRADRRLADPTGGIVSVYLHGGDSVRGELLGTRQVGSFTVLVTENGRQRIVVVPEGGAASMWYSKIWRPWPVPLAAYRFNQVTREARFTFGITDSALAALMREIGQERVDTIGRPAPLGAELDNFMSAARAGTQRYQSPARAAADGFRRVGTEFPFMGEHWVNLARVLENRFDAASPSVLTYVTGPRGPVLAGVGYGALLRPGESVPAGPAPASAWHEHSGAIADESLPVHGPGASHHGGNAAGASTDSLRFMVLHAWVWTENPDGMFVTDNKALPLTRLGARAVLAADALRGLTLAQDSAGYYVEMLRTSLRASETESRVLEGIVAERRALARRGVRTDALDTALLRDAWAGLWRELERALPAHSTELIRLRSAL